MQSAGSRTRTFRPPRPLSQADVTDRIRQAILANDFIPGQRLVEADLCDRLGVSRGTVRAALLDLTHEGLVERIANRGARVRDISVEEVLQLTDVSLAVECLCVVLAAERITAPEIIQLRALGEELKVRAALNDVIAFGRTTRRIFNLYLSISGQLVAQELLERLHERNAGHRSRLLCRPGRAQVALPQWLAVIDAICRRDPDAAQAALRALATSVKEAMVAQSQEASGARATARA
ncbi:GntR family transcriptional regulator [Amaricoccus macauensis]|uniref:GntR family transcriptional regulator n=1 Tax=Amaricoccus macauensis TaxID=57001 RepID=UPI001608D829|nr:GntR family transcriptional regulator [Amaricoccus macauensis]